MITSADLAEFVKSLPTQTVDLDTFHFNRMDLNVLLKDAGDEPLHLWWKNKNMTPHISKVVAKALLSLDPPEQIRSAILLLML